MEKDDESSFCISCYVQISVDQLLFISKGATCSFFLLTLSGDDTLNVGVDIRQLQINHENTRSKTRRKLEDKKFFDFTTNMFLLNHTKKDVREAEELVLKLTNLPIDLVRLIIRKLLEKA